MSTELCDSATALRPCPLTNMHPTRESQQSTTTTVHSLLLESRKINGNNTQAHIKSSTFTTLLSGRFYENNSLHSYQARRRKLARMKTRRDDLKKAVKFEEVLIKTFEKVIREQRRVRRETLFKRKKLEKGTICLQSLYRRKCAWKRVERLKEENRIRNRLALFMQCWCRGSKGRQKAARRKRELEEISAAVRIQSFARITAAKRRLLQRKLARKKLRIRAATRIQAIERGKTCRKEYRRLLQEFKLQKLARAVIRLQSALRRLHGKRLAIKRRMSLEAVKKHRLMLAKRATLRKPDPPKKPFTTGKPRDITKASLVKASLFGKKTPLSSPDPCFIRSRISHRQDDAKPLSPFGQQHHATETDQKVIKARLRAAARVAALNQKMRNAKTKAVQDAKLAASRVAELEAKRRSTVRSSSKTSIGSKKTMSSLRNKDAVPSRDETKSKRDVLDQDCMSTTTLSEISVIDEEDLDDQRGDAVSFSRQSSGGFPRETNSLVAIPSFDNSFEEEFDENEHDLELN